MLNNKRGGKRRGGERGEDHVLQNDDMRAAKNVVDKAVSDTIEMMRITRLWEKNASNA